MAIADARRTILHYCNGDGKLISLLEGLEIAVNDHLDAVARDVFIKNRKAELEAKIAEEESVCPGAGSPCRFCGNTHPRFACRESCGTIIKE